MEIIHFEGDEKPRLICTPYIYARMVECSKHFIVYRNGNAKVILKKKGNKHK